ncbi:hypothetical protein GCM10008995_01230 [Halobellus salinus]|uniref:UPF0146 protein GCM10008995_01230 n=1 Tax=Halobellus salinus TaxID=931585 RepID=A0A830ELE9_9EURY|nr:UPF0146 family protein [Halobellus salinus]GGI94761.1 hypothetical protein GCM10008995_01230 [Halobellus salinus]SMP20296.1 hypothetical protein SAMN06265347_107127 [Halobellus salinus]
MSTRRDTALVGRFSEYASAVEVGIGRRSDIAAGLADAGVAVAATDVVDCDVPPSVSFARDDVVTASERDHPGAVYDADLLYGLNLPPELHRPALAVAEAVDADFRFTTLGGDPPAVSAVPTSLPGGGTLYVAHGDER